MITFSEIFAKNDYENEIYNFTVNKLEPLIVFLDRLSKIAIFLQQIWDNSKGKYMYSSFF